MTLMHKINSVILNSQKWTAKLNDLCSQLKIIRSVIQKLNKRCQFIQSDKAVYTSHEGKNLLAEMNIV